MFTLRLAFELVAFWVTNIEIALQMTIMAEADYILKEIAIRSEIFL